MIHSQIQIQSNSRSRSWHLINSLEYKKQANDEDATQKKCLKTEKLHTEHKYNNTDTNKYEQTHETNTKTG